MKTEDKQNFHIPMSQIARITVAAEICISAGGIAVCKQRWT